MPRQIIQTDHAPAAIGPYSQAVRSGQTVYFSGQIPLDPATGALVEGDIAVQARRAFDNLQAVAEAAGGSLAQIVRLGLYLTDLGQFAAVNAVMQEYFTAPFPSTRIKNAFVLHLTLSQKAKKHQKIVISFYT